MKWLDALQTRAKLLFDRTAAESRMDEEFRFHVEMETDANIRAGLPPAEARRRALVAFGGVERHKERMRDERGGRSVTDAFRDVRYAGRTLRRSPGFSIVAVLTLGVGTGAVTAVFALVDAILIQPLPYPDSDRLVAIKHAAPGLGLAKTGLSSGIFFHYRANARSLDALELYSEGVVNLSGGETAAERVALAMVGPEFFQVLGVRPVLGRLFTQEEVARQDGMNMTGTIPVLLSHDLWLRRYGGDLDIVGRAVDINTRSREVVGVLPPGFAFPRPDTEMWMLAVTPVVTANFARNLGYDAIARLRPGVTSEDAEAELSRILPAIQGAYPDATASRLEEVQLQPLVVPLKSQVVGSVGGALWILLGSMSLLMLVACANVANLVLARSHRQAREVAVRMAMGARRVELVRLHLSESALLALAGAALGLLLARWALALLVTLTPVELPRMGEVGLDARVFALASGLALFVSFFVGLIAVLRHSRTTNLSLALKGGGRVATEGPAGRRLRGALVAAQVALAVTLLVGSSLMIQSFGRLMHVERGFDAEGVLVVDMGLPFSRAAGHMQIFNSLLERVRAIPGVTGAAAVSELPLTESPWTQPMAYPLGVSDRPVSPGEFERPVDLRFFMPGYFEVMQTPVLDGRAFALEEQIEASHPVVISAALAARFFPGDRAVGKRIRRFAASGQEIVLRGPSGEVIEQPDYTVVGIVADVREESLRGEQEEIVYIPVREPRVDPGFIPTEMSLVIRSDLPPLMLAPAIRQVIRETDPVLGVARIQTLEGIVSASAGRERLLAILLLVAGIGALFLGAVGTYGVVSDTVRQRTREIALRVALGARAGRIAGMVLADSMTFVIIGGIVGLGAALSGTLVLRSFLFSVSPTDPATLISVAALVLGIAAAATLVPALRAAAVDPVEALSVE